MGNHLRYTFVIVSGLSLISTIYMAASTGTDFWYELAKMHFSNIMKKKYIYIYGLWRQCTPLPNTHWYSPLEQT
ncbi:hypothetical protein FD755_021853, partial [Muntiacus reevesi]